MSRDSRSRNLHSPARILKCEILHFRSRGVPIDASPLLLPINVQRLTDAVYRTLKEQILSQAFAPGQRLHVDVLAARLGVSRTPVKDALNALASEGLVEIIPRKGTFVAGISAEEIAEVFELRRALELLAAELLVARITDEGVRRLRDRLAVLDAVDDGDVGEHMRRNMAFHRLFVQLAGNRRLFEIYESLNVHIQIARVHARRENWRQRRRQERQEHQAIMRALEARDGPGLAAAVNAHIQRSKRSLMEDLRSMAVTKPIEEGVGRHRRTEVRVSSSEVNSS
ncbi:MAG: GntR family transcriptional regulator [Armatimonadota bacterium]|nr:GntR family transcriptional regulator [Armatimonadota bacterium]